MMNEAEKMKPYEFEWLAGMSETEKKNANMSFREWNSEDNVMWRMGHFDAWFWRGRCQKELYANNARYREGWDDGMQKFLAERKARMAVKKGLA